MIFINILCYILSLIIRDCVIMIILFFVYVFKIYTFYIVYAI